MTAIVAEAQPTHGVSFAEAVRVWLRVALLSFGGPAGQIAVMHRILVEEKRWIGEARFLHALNYCMLLPGPEAQQLTVYIGWLLHRTAGGLVAGLLFILPGVVAIMGLSLLYAAFGQLPVVAALFFGLKAAVLAIVLEAVVRIGRRALRGRAMVALAAAAFVLIFFAGVPFPLIVLGAALLGLTGIVSGAPLIAAKGGAVDALLDAGTPLHARPSAGRTLGVALVWLAIWLGPVAAILWALGPDSVFSQIATFFSTMAVVTFGGAYAVLAYVAQQAVEVFGWLTPGEMLDGLGMAETTPGPLIMVLQFVGFLGAFREASGLDPYLAGVLGGLLATWVTFAPSFMWIFVGAPYVERLRGNRALGAALSAITAAVVGVILNLAVWFALHTLFGRVDEVGWGWLTLLVPDPATLDPAALVLAVAAVVALFVLRLGMMATLAGAAALGVLWRLATGAIV